MVPAVQEKLKAIYSAKEELAHASSSKIGDLPLIQYVLDFWTPESPYVQECAVIKKKPLSTRYVQSQYNAAKLHIATYPGFKNLTVGELTADHIHDWMRWCAEQGLTGGRINKVVEAIRGAVVDAFKMKIKGETAKEAHDKLMERGKDGKNEKYLDNDVKIKVQKDFADGVREEAQKRIEELERQEKALTWVLGKEKDLEKIRRQIFKKSKY
jgi:hypothetical protein